MSERAKIPAKTPEAKRKHTISRKQKTTRSQSGSSPVDRILHLQRTLGNQAVQRMMKSGALQAKLRIGQPNDKYEQEADRVADQVMRMPEPRVQLQPEEEEEKEKIQSKPLSEQITPLVQRQVEPEEEEEPIQTKLVDSNQISRQKEELEEEEEPLMTKSISDSTQKIGEDIHVRLNRSRGGGQPLSEADKSFMERRFGTDFSGVRVHTDSNSAQMNRDLNAQAFTHGRDIYFGARRYSSDTLQGKRLLAHELTHILQQSHSNI